MNSELKLRPSAQQRPPQKSQQLVERLGEDIFNV